MTKYSEMQLRNTPPDPHAYENGDLWSTPMVVRILNWAEDDTLDADVPFADNPVDLAIRRFAEHGYRDVDAAPRGSFKDFVGDVVRYKRFRLTSWPNAGTEVGTFGGAGLFVGDLVRATSAMMREVFEGEVVATQGLDVLLWLDSERGWSVDTMDQDWRYAHPGVYEAGERRGGTFWWVGGDQVTLVDRPAVPESGSAPSQPDTADLQARLVRTEHDLEVCRELSRRSERTIDTIMSKLLEEADDRGWCTEHEKVLAWLEAETGRDFSNYRRTRTAQASWDEYYLVRVTRSESFEGNNLVDDDDVDMDSVQTYVDNADTIEDRLRSALSHVPEFEAVEFHEMVDDSLTARLI